MRMDRRWFPARAASATTWTARGRASAWADSDGDQPPKPATTSFAKTADPIVNKLAPSLVLVNFDMPYSVSGITERNYYGTGLIVDAERGLVVVDRNTVPAPLGDVRLTFAGTIEIPGARRVHPSAAQPRGRLLRPEADRHDAGASAATLRAAELHPGEQVWAVGVRPDGKVQSRSATVASIDPVAFPLSRTLQFRDANLETIALVNGPATTTACWSTRAARWSRAGRASPTKPAARSRRRIAAFRPTLLQRDAAAGARRARPAFAGGGAAAGAAGERAQARSAGRVDRSGWSSTARSAGRCSACSAWSAARRRRSCCSPGDLILDVDGAS